ncbi:MAG: hypothetical protein ACRDAW_03065 [Metamycoplasmataceae bacterium]
MFKKSFFSLLISSAIVLPIALTSSCSSSINNIEEDVNANVDKNLYSEVFNYLLIGQNPPYNIENDLNKTFFNGTKESLDSLNAIIKSEINKPRNQAVLKVFLLKDLSTIYRNIFNESGIAISLSNIDENYRAYEKMIDDDTPGNSNDSGKDSQTFINLQKLIDSIVNIEIKIMNNFAINSINPKYWWEYSYQIQEGSKLLSLFQDDKGVEKPVAIYRNVSLNSDQEKIINSQPTEERKDLARKYFQYQSTTRYWDNVNRKIVSVPVQSNFNLFLENDNIVESGYVSSKQKQTRNFFALDMKKVAQDQYKFFIKLSTKESLTSFSSNSGWKDYFAKGKNKDLQKDILIDLGLPALKINKK